MKNILPIFLTFLIYPYAQSDSTITTDQLLQDILEESSVDLEEDYLFDFIENLEDNPVNLNTADISVLLSIPFLDLNSAQSILDYREKYGKFFSTQELYAVNGLGKNVARVLQLFTVVEAKKTKPFIDLSNVSLEFRTRLIRDLQVKQGFKDGSYLGDEYKSYNRMKVRFGNFSITSLIEKDPGEEKLNDFSSFSMSFNEYSLINKIIGGDYLVEFGQGLIYWGPYSFGKGNEAVSTVSRSARTLRDYTSTDENQFYRGTAGNFDFGRIEFTLLYSSNSIDANIDSETGQITSFPLGGYHRTTNEIGDFNSTDEKVFGLLLSGNPIKSLKLGAAYQNIKYNLPIAKGDLFSPEGNSFSFYAFSYSWLLDKFRLSGELAYNEISVASINNLEWVLSDRISIVTSVRNYPRNFYTIKGTGFGESSNTSNEVGIYNGIRWRSDFGIINFYYDQFKFPYQSFNSVYPSSGEEFLLNYQFRPVPRSLLEIKIKRENKEVTEIMNNEEKLIDQSKTNLRLSYDYYVLENLRFRSRIEYVFYQQTVTNESEKGYLLLHDFRYDLFESIRFYGRVVLFNTDSYNSRVYQFENDMRGILNNPALYGKGTRWYLMIEYDLLPFARFSAKYSELYKPDEFHLSSGKNEILGNLDNRISVQIDIKF